MVNAHVAGNDGDWADGGVDGGVADVKRFSEKTKIDEMFSPFFFSF